MDLAAEVGGQIGVGIGHGLILADETAQLMGQDRDARLQCGIRERRLDIDGPNHAGAQQQHGGEREAYHGASACSFWISGTSCLSMMSGVKGPMILSRIMPCLSTRKVSGAP